MQMEDRDHSRAKASKDQCSFPLSVGLVSSRTCCHNLLAMRLRELWVPVIWIVAEADNWSWEPQTRLRQPRMF